MIRPWYRSRLFWVGIPGLLFLLWGWWDSGNAVSHLGIEGPRVETFVIDIEQGSIGFQVRLDAESSRRWDFSYWRDNITENGFSIDLLDYLKKDGSPVDLLHAGEPRKRRFDFPSGFRFEKERDEMLGENPAAEGWVASPGAQLPTPELKGFKVGIACWLLVLLYLVLWGGLLGMWQRRKARLLQKSSAVS